MSKIWIVVADEAKARVLSTDKSSGPLVEVNSMTSSEGTMMERDLVSDKPGRSSDSSGTGIHSVGEKSEHKEQYAIRFAKELSDDLEKNLRSKAFMKLIIVAAPHFLGLLRNELSPADSEMVSLEVNKDLTIMEPKDIREHHPQNL